jgi:hypothetical protein
MRLVWAVNVRGLVLPLCEPNVSIDFLFWGLTRPHGPIEL